MKKIILLALLGIGLFSCNQKQVENKRKMQEIERERLRVDSIKAYNEKLKIDSLALIAWGDSKFGMSPKEVLKTVAFKGADGYNKGTRLHDGSMSRSYIAMPYEKRNIDGLEFDIQEFHAHFKMDELYLITIKTYSKDANFINYMIRDANLLSSKFSEKYGEPVYKKSSVNIFDFENGRWFIYMKWEIGQKTITIYFAEEKYSSSYFYEINIHNTLFPTKVDTEEIEAKKKAAEEKEKKEQYQF